MKRRSDTILYINYQTMLLECAVAAVFIETVTSALAAPQAGPALRGWYRTFGMGAVAMDLLSLCVGVYAGLKLASVFGFEDSIASKVFVCFCASGSRHPIWSCASLPS